ncbi:hypothetical protein FEF26_07505 [Nesterenkonia salmonea]|uniref:ABC transporter permease n=1 Tax=Nesterenkonia salmonea TaxID=1804987 RepID=A0A5R9BB38_9MICC|nr:hypothetical protein [Nesterenkonia salmonea]TLP97442.1 hypothetical protein FEF26_07505 [Nesterenkonia salmonea]
MTAIELKHDHTLSGTGALLRFMLRRDRIRTNAWVVGIGVAAFYFAHAIQVIAESADELRSLTIMFADPVGRMMSGPGFGMEEPTHERFFASGYVLYLYILIALMSAFTVVRHTRMEEQTGRAELIRANVVGRHSTLTATLVLTGAANAVVAALVWMAAFTAGYAAIGSALVALGGFVVGLFFAGVAAVTSQLCETSRGAAATAGGAIGVAFLIRMGGDAAEPGGSAASWFSPLAWSQQTAPYVDDRWWPLLLTVGGTILLLWLSFSLSARRDLGASLLPTRPGRPNARPTLGSPLGLAFHTLKGTLRGWGIALILTGLMFGSFAQTMVDAADDLPQEMAQIFAGEDMVKGYLAYAALFVAVFVAAMVVGAMQQLRNEETHGRAELGLSTPMSRVTWLGAHVTVLLLGIATVLVAVGSLMGVGAVAVLQGNSEGFFVELLAACVHQAPAVLAVVGIVVAFFGWLPRASGSVGWAIVGYSAIMANFGQLLELPQFFHELNIFGHLSPYPVEAVSWTSVVILTGMGVTGILVGLLGWHLREINRA